MSDASDELVSYVLLTYNQENFVIEALSSAFAQTFKSLEILISDDCSTDNTYAMLLKEVEQYSGPHKVRLLKQEQNLGITGHMNKVLGMVSAKLVVISSGDDISDPCKTERIYQAWVDSGALVVGCNPVIIDEKGKKLGRFYQSKVPECITPRYIVESGNTSIFVTALDKTVFDQWGDLPSNHNMEDQLIPFRASLLKSDGVVVIDEPLVQYRQHDESGFEGYVIKGAVLSWGSQFEQKFDSYIERYEAWLKDIERCSWSAGLKCLGLTQELATIAENRITFFKTLRYLLTEKSLLSRLKKLSDMFTLGEFTKRQLLTGMFFSFSPGLAIMLTRLLFKIGFIGNVGKRGIREPFLKLN